MYAVLPKRYGLHSPGTFFLIFLSPIKFLTKKTWFLKTFKKLGSVPKNFWFVPNFVRNNVHLVGTRCQKIISYFLPYSENYKKIKVSVKFSKMIFFLYESYWPLHAKYCIHACRNGVYFMQRMTFDSFMTFLNYKKSIVVQSFRSYVFQTKLLMYSS